MRGPSCKMLVCACASGSSSQLMDQQHAACGAQSMQKEVALLAWLRNDLSETWTLSLTWRSCHAAERPAAVDQLPSGPTLHPLLVACSQ